MSSVRCPDCDGSKLSLFETLGDGKCSTCHGQGKTLMDSIVGIFGAEAAPEAETLGERALFD